MTVGRAGVAKSYSLILRNDTNNLRGESVHVMEPFPEFYKRNRDVFVEERTFHAGCLVLSKKISCEEKIDKEDTSESSDIRSRQFVIQATISHDAYDTWARFSKPNVVDSPENVTVSIMDSQNKSEFWVNIFYDK
ncbi:hypothetical protein Ciccas_007781 [Cichlidogyrus casuarinus]|uniref:Uncharacterized protein n=1 Tax=Cichlidogyrus casuarinus TaxID=1844966 RepID=A0ABD2Q297_9PLAT